MVSNTLSYPLPISTSNALPARTLKRSATPKFCAFSCATFNTFGQSSATISAFGFFVATVIPYIPWPAAMSNTLQGLPSSARSSAAINCEDGTARGAIPRAKATQNSSFGLVLSPPSDQTEPPLRTASVSEWKRARVWSLPKNPAIDATHAGDLRSRKNADSWVSAYFPSWSLIRNP